MNARRPVLYHVREWTDANQRLIGMLLGLAALVAGAPALAMLGPGAGAFGLVFGAAFMATILFYYVFMAEWLRDRSFISNLNIQTFGAFFITFLFFEIGTTVFGVIHHGGDWLGYQFAAQGQWRIDLLMSFPIAVILTFTSLMSALVGPGIMSFYYSGRYHRPRREERVVLFLDLEDSAGHAERLGEIRFHALLRKAYADVSASVINHRGQIHQYLGDGLFATWRMKHAVPGAMCLRAVFAIHDRIDADARSYMREFGAVPRFRAGFHAGPLVAGEVGLYKKDIMFLGDTVNTAALIEEACEIFGKPFIITREVLQYLDPPAYCRVDSLGPFTPRGSNSQTELFAIERVEGKAAQTQAQKTRNSAAA